MKSKTEISMQNLHRYAELGFYIPGIKVDGPQAVIQFL